MNTEKVKVGLLGLIAVTLLINTYYMATKKEAAPIRSSQVVENAHSNIPQAPANPQPLPPNQMDPSLNALPSATNTPAGPTTNIAFAEDIKDFGKVLPQSENTYAFEFVNTGNEPLIIENAKGSCGCTVPDWPKNPIMPGEKGMIDVVFKPKDRTESGEDKKTVTVTANTSPKNTVLTVKAFVEVK